MPHMPSLSTPLRLTILLAFGFAAAACSGEALESHPVGNSSDSADQAAAENTPEPAKPAPASSQPAARPSASTQACANCGTVASVTPVERKGEASGAGAAGGAVLGGVIGNQIGSGSGRKIATVVGAIGGGYAGHKAEERSRSSTVYEVVIRMDSGDTRRLEMVDAAHLHSGQKVAIHGDAVVLRN